MPCYSVGIKELRQGENRIFLTTDGLIECPNEAFSNPINIYNTFLQAGDDDSILSMLKTIQENNVRDSTTIVTWKVNSLKEATRASNQI